MNGSSVTPGTDPNRSVTATRSYAGFAAARKMSSPFLGTSRPTNSATKRSGAKPNERRTSPASATGAALADTPGTRLDVHGRVREVPLRGHPLRDRGVEAGHAGRQACAASERRESRELDPVEQCVALRNEADVLCDDARDVRPPGEQERRRGGRVQDVLDVHDVGIAHRVAKRRHEPGRRHRPWNAEAAVEDVRRRNAGDRERVPVFSQRSGAESAAHDLDRVPAPVDADGEVLREALDAADVRVEVRADEDDAHARNDLTTACVSKTEAYDALWQGTWGEIQRVGPVHRHMHEELLRVVK